MWADNWILTRNNNKNNEASESEQESERFGANCASSEEQHRELSKRFFSSSFSPRCLIVYFREAEIKRSVIGEWKVFGEQKTFGSHSD